MQERGKDGKGKGVSNKEDGVSKVVTFFNIQTESAVANRTSS